MTYKDGSLLAVKFINDIREKSGEDNLDAENAYAVEYLRHWIGVIIAENPHLIKNLEV